MSIDDKPDRAIIKANAESLTRECDWFARVLNARLELYYENRSHVQSVFEILPPDLDEDTSSYAQLVTHHQMGFKERLVLILAVIPYLRPQLLDSLQIENESLNRRYSEFGGCTGERYEGFLPTGETALFLLAGNDLEKRIAFLSLFEHNCFLYTGGILREVEAAGDDPNLSAVLAPASNTLKKLTSGKDDEPGISSAFPAQRITTELTWDDLVLPDSVLEQVQHINVWLNQGDTIRTGWGLSRHVKSGLTCIFHGPAGTGKTLTATLIGAKAGADVYRVNVPLAVSKYIGETEKNLSRVFDRAASNNWILFFDEADALFSRRSEVKDSHDRYANQEVSYLLQRIEDYPGTVILEADGRFDIDPAFVRRIQAVIYFPMPDVDERYQLWRVIVGNKLPLDHLVDLEELAHKYELSGGSVVNVVHSAATRALRLQRSSVTREDLVNGIRQELRKEVRTV